MSAICYISVLVFVPNKTSADSKANYGPYADKGEAEKNLKKGTWKQQKSFPDTWEIGKISGDGHAKMATVITIPCNPRNQLPLE